MRLSQFQDLRPGHSFITMTGQAYHVVSEPEYLEDRPQSVKFTVVGAVSNKRRELTEWATDQVQIIGFSPWVAKMCAY